MLASVLTFCLCDKNLAVGLKRLLIVGLFASPSGSVHFLMYLWPLKCLLGEMSLQVICNRDLEALVNHPSADVCLSTFYHSSLNFPGSWHFLFSQKTDPA